METLGLLEAYLVKVDRYQKPGSCIGMLPITVWIVGKQQLATGVGSWMPETLVLLTLRTQAYREI